MTEPRLQPQLVMRRPDLHNLPAVHLPDGFHLRLFREGDERAWEIIIAESFHRELQPNEFENAIKSRPPFKPERVLFVVSNDVPVATATAWEEPKYGQEAGYLHMVGVRPGHQGKRLGYWVSVAVLHRFVVEGRKKAVLQTDDFRLPAVKTYLALGFEPLLVDENQRQRWPDVFAALGRRDELVGRFADVLGGPLQRFEEK